MQGFRAASSALAPIDINSPARVAPPSDSKYKSMVGELQEMVEELEAENHGLNEALANEQQNVEQYKGEYERIQQEGSALFEKYENKVKRQRPSLAKTCPSFFLPCRSSNSCTGRLHAS